MPILITMPALSPTMTDGNLAKWLKSEGDAIAIGDVIAEIETDKATMEVEAIDEGILGRIIVPAGSEQVAVNAIIGLILKEGEDVSALEEFSKSGAITSSPMPNKQEKSEAAAMIEPKTPEVSPTLEYSPVAEPPAVSELDGERIKISPLARRMAEQAGLALSRITGSGPNGRIVKADIDVVLNRSVQTSVTAPSVSPEPPDKVPVEVPHTKMRQIIASRLTESKQTVPHIYLSIDCEVDEILEFRERLNSRSEQRGEEYKLTVNDFVVLAVALALRDVPRINSSWTDEAIIQHSSSDVAIAVSLDDGLITPIIRNAEKKGLVTISRECKELAGRAREGKLMPEEYQGGSFTVSNLGMFGIKEFGAIINPPHSGILAVGVAEKRPVVKDSELAIATTMTCTISIDHRVVDGAVAALFLQTFKGYMDEPLSMIL